MHRYIQIQQIARDDMSMRRWNTGKIKSQHTDETLKKPPVMSQTEKEARIYEAAKRLGVKLGGKK